LNSNVRGRSTEDKWSSVCSQNCNYSSLQQQLSVWLHCTSDRISWYPVRSCGRRLQSSRPVEAAFAAHLGRTLADPYIRRSVPSDGVDGRGTDKTPSVLTPSSSRVHVSSTRHTCPRERPSLQPGALEGTRAHFRTQRALQPPTLFARSGIPARGSQLGTAARWADPCAPTRPAADGPTRAVVARRRGLLWRMRPSPPLFARSGFPARGSQLYTAAGRAGRCALRPLALLLSALQRSD